MQNSRNLVVLQVRKGQFQPSKASFEGLKSMLVRYAMSKKRAYLDQGIVTKDTFWDRKVLKVLQAQLGGRVHTIFCGAAPLGTFCLSELCYITPLRKNV